MRLHHKTPCAECPWRSTSAPGWLGGHSAESYADPVAMNEVPACHMRDHGPSSPDTAFCVGALGTMKKSCTSAWKSPGADKAKALIDVPEEVFRHPALFYKHHTGEDYVNPIIRQLSKGAR